MRKLKRSYLKAVNAMKFLFVAGALVAGAILTIGASSYAQYLWLISASVFLVFVLKLLFRSCSDTYINENGYVVLSSSNELEHRFIAKQLLGRELKANEIVHHINGKKTDNRVWNLCLMDREKHEHFHAWLSWKKNKSGRYPSFRDQKKILEEEYGGTLLEKINATKKTSLPVISETKSKSKIADPPETEWSAFLPDPDDRKITTTRTNKLHPDLQKKLFVELRNERKRLADQLNVPAYKIFHDKTLIEMSETMPDSKHAMFEIKAMEKEKYETYGPQFIAVIRKLKNDCGINKRKKRIRLERTRNY